MDFFRSLSVAVVGVAALSGTARAEEPWAVYFGGSCMPPGTSADEVRRILEAELSPVRVLPLTNVEQPRPEDAILGLYGCTDTPPGARVSITRHGERRERFVALSDAAPGTLGRTLSLALAEAARDPKATDPVPETWPLGASPPVSPVAPPAPRPPPITTMTTTNDGARAPERPAPNAHGPESRRSTALMPRASVLFRFMPASSTPALGVDGGVAHGRTTAGLMVLAARRTEPLGAATLVAIAGSASFDVIELGAFVTARIAGEVGAAIGSPTPNATAVGHTRGAFHGALLGGFASVLPIGGSYEMETFIGGGYGSSLNAEADGRRLGSLGGAFLTIQMGLRLP
jgi:hypothetical protein